MRLPARRNIDPWALAGWAALALAAVAALWRPVIPFDGWWYHLPFAARIWGIGEGAAFGLEPRLAERWLGMPRAWHAIQGAFWFATGSLRFVMLPQILLLLGFLLWVRRVYLVPPGLLVIGLFASPLLLIHLQTVYHDLPVGLCLAGGFLTLIALVDGARGRHGRIDGATALLAVATLGLAGNIKYQGTLGAMLVIGIAALLAGTMPGITAGRRLALLGVLAIALLAATLALADNVWRFGQPLYPLEVEAFGRVLLAGSESSAEDANPPRYLLAGAQEVGLPGPLTYLLSLTELDWTLRGVAPWYNVDGQTGRLPRRGPPSRTGGLGAAFVLAHLALLAWQAARWRSLPDDRQRILVLGTVLLAVFLAFMPRAHELRYWLVLPLVLVVANLRWLALLGWPGASRTALLGLMLYGVALSVLSSKSDLLARPSVAQDVLHAEIPPDIAATQAATGWYCDQENRQLFRFSAAVTGGPGKVSRTEAVCR